MPAAGITPTRYRLRPPHPPTPTSCSKSLRAASSAVLVLPDALSPREVRALLGVALADLGFAAAVVHQEALAATFAAGATTACVVNLGAQVRGEGGTLTPAWRRSPTWGDLQAGVRGQPRRAGA